MDLRTDLTKTITGWVVTGLLALLVFCVVTIYRSYEQMIASGNDLLLEQANNNNRLNLLGEFVDETRPILERSTSRCLKIEGLSHYKKDELVDAAVQSSWHATSVRAMSDASEDLASLDRFSPETVPLAVSNLDGLRRVLNSELSLWRKADSYIDEKARLPHDTNREEQSFQEFAEALLTYSTSIASYGAAAKQTGDRLLLSKEDARTSFERQMNARDQMRRHFRLAYLGAILSFLAIFGALAFIAYPHVKRIGSNTKNGSKVGTTSHQGKRHKRRRSK